ncbi:enoyl-CoA hydratase-related protein [Sphingobium limneticum]|uniref:enoyl-CoA hydratase-related protein n=1 Tax=Sphingobium limneticum TaxID=1007511 RepID=UPI003CFD33C3
MENFTLEVGADGVAIVTFDTPNRSMNIISHAVQDDLGLLAQRLHQDAAIAGAILCSGKASGFCAGADLAELQVDIERWREAATQEDLRAGLAEAGGFSRRIRDLETVGKPLVAVIGGVVLGGGLELALGCHHRIAIDDENLRLGLPEATLGLMPGAGGTQRLARLAGLNAAMPYLLDALPLGADAALSLGVIHEHATRDRAMERARQWIVDGGAAVAPWDEKVFRLPHGGPHAPAGYALFAPAIAARRGGEGTGDAHGNILKALYEGSQVPMNAALRIESRYFFNTARTSAARERISAFLNRKAKCPAL